MTEQTDTAARPAVHVSRFTLHGSDRVEIYADEWGRFSHWADVLETRLRIAEQALEELRTIAEPCLCGDGPAHFILTEQVFHENEYPNLSRALEALNPAQEPEKT